MVAKLPRFFNGAQIFKATYNEFIMKPKFHLIRIVSKVHKFIYVASRGRLTTSWKGLEFILLTTTGSVSGKERKVPLAAIRHEGSYILIASFGGSPTPPGWLTNIEQNSSVRIAIGPTTVDANAAIIDSSRPEYPAMWAKAVTAYKGFDNYRRATTRQIPVVLITPTSE